MAEESMKDYEKEINESLERQKKIETEEDLGWDRLRAEKASEASSRHRDFRADMWTISIAM